jgi:hypothetical protein
MKKRKVETLREYAFKVRCVGQPQCLSSTFGTMPSIATGGSLPPIPVDRSDQTVRHWFLILCQHAFRPTTSKRDAVSSSSRSSRRCTQAASAGRLDQKKWSCQKVKNPTTKLVDSQQNNHIPHSPSLRHGWGPSSAKVAANTSSGGVNRQVKELERPVAAEAGICNRFWSRSRWR